MEVTVRHGVRVLVYPPDGPSLSSEQDALDLVSAVFSDGAEVAVVPSGRFPPDFFQLRTRVAGEFIQKLVNYRIRLAIVGDIAHYVDESEALAAFVTESNRGGQVWFLGSLEELDARLERSVR